ncbi:helix-turn-helix domain-containing protein [Rhodanobacter geophilus]|uniref:Helix-turn-helix domain-containing protein n=1 Tax=Rhodanobacter geophilus TaxID=3162488 RepID=A0ABV3QPZ9_9GAMM
MSAPQKRRSPREAGNEVCLGGQLQSITDTSTAAQRQRLLAHLRHDSIDTITARRRLNIMMPAARVKELRDQGHNIATVRISRADTEGRQHNNVALYTLVPGGKQ